MAWDVFPDHEMLGWYVPGRKQILENLKSDVLPVRQEKMLEWSVSSVRKKNLDVFDVRRFAFAVGEDGVVDGVVPFAREGGKYAGVVRFASL